MLSIISWGSFTGFLLLLVSLYYVIILVLFFRQELWVALRRRLGRGPHFFLLAGLLLCALLHCLCLQAQTVDGNTGINQANTMVRSYYESAVNLVYGIAAIGALIGAVAVYNKMGARGSAHGNLSGEIAIWFGAIIFMVVVTTVIKAFFGL